MWEWSKGETSDDQKMMEDDGQRMIVALDDDEADVPFLVHPLARCSELMLVLVR